MLLVASTSPHAADDLRSCRVPQMICGLVECRQMICGPTGCRHVTRCGAALCRRSRVMLRPDSRLLQIARSVELEEGAVAETRLRLESGSVDSRVPAVQDSKQTPRFEIRTPRANRGGMRYRISNHHQRHENCAGDVRAHGGKFFKFGHRFSCKRVRFCRCGGQWSGGESGLRNSCDDHRP